MPETQPALHAHLSERGLDAFHFWCETGGVSYSAMVESICSFIADALDDKVPPDEIFPDLILSARTIDHLRRRRGRVRSR